MAKRAKPHDQRREGAGRRLGEPIIKTKPKVTKPRVTKPKVPKIPDTREGLLGQIGALLGKVDAVMEAPRTRDVTFSRWSSSLFDKEANQMADLVERLDRVLRAELPDDIAAQDLVWRTWDTEPGKVPSWARAGTFLVWINYIPCRCVWGGFMQPTADIVAADPKEPWITPAGAISVSPYILTEFKTPEDLFRYALVAKTKERLRKPAAKSWQTGKDIGPAFNLHSLDAETGRASAEKELERNPWLVEALKRGEVNPIPLPPHLQAVQVRWFG